MDAYIYQADLYCEDCTDVIKSEIDGFGKFNTGNSDNWPQGPYSNGGGESDSPAHCGRCGVFLKNTLTSDVYEYVYDSFAEFICSGKGNADTIVEWEKFYNITFEDLINRAKNMSTENSDGI